MTLTPTYSIYLRIFTLPVLSAIACCFQLILFDYPFGHDWIFELVRLEEYYAALQSGQIFPYWGNNLYNGFGSPIFLYYAPLYNILASCFLALGASLTNAASLTLICLMIFAAIGMTGLMWEVHNRRTDAHVILASQITAIAYVFAPYLLANMLVRNASAEFTAMCLAPYPFWGIAMLHNNKHGGFLLLALGLALSILAHNLTALVITTILVLNISILFIKHKQYRFLSKGIFSVITGIGLASWFWIPALWLKDEVRINEMLSGKFYYQNNFNSITELFSYSHFYTVGLLPLFTLLLSLLILKRSKNKLFPGCLILAAYLFLFLQSSASIILWDNIPFMPLFQFTWRMMGPFSFVIAILTGLIFSYYKIKSKLIELLIILTIILNAIPLYELYQPLPNDISNIIPKSITPDGVRINGLPATVLDEYLPNSADKSIIQERTLSLVPFLTELPTTTKIITNNNQYIHLVYDSDISRTIELSLWDFPVWKVKFDSEEINSVQKNTKGVLLLSLPAGTHSIELLMSQPSIRKAGFMISGFFFIIFCVMLIGNNRKCTSILKVSH